MSLNHQNWPEVFLVAVLSNSRTPSLAFSLNLGSRVWVWEEPGDLGQESSVLAPPQHGKSSLSLHCAAGLFLQKSWFTGAGWGPSEWLRCAARVRNHPSLGSWWPLANRFTSLDCSSRISKISLGLEVFTPGCQSAPPREKYRIPSPSCLDSLNLNFWGQGPGPRSLCSFNCYPHGINLMHS